MKILGSEKFGSAMVMFGLFSVLMRSEADNLIDDMMIFGSELQRYMWLCHLTGGMVAVVA